VTADLVAFLHARLDDTEPEEHSRYSAGEVYDKPCPHCGEHLTGYQQGFGESETELIPCGHVLTWEEFKVFAAVESRADRRVLADVQAKRAILAMYEHKVESMQRYPNQGNANAMIALIQVVEALAQPFADHPDFDPAWVVSTAAGGAHPG
jgi:hypothetical protein